MGSPFTTTLNALATEQSNQLTASPASCDYLRNLMLDKAVATGHDADQAKININAWLAGKSQAEVSANIDRLKAEGFTGYRSKSVKTVSGDPAMGYVPSPEVVPAGRYAIETGDGATNGLAFYKVDRPTEGRWAGYVFVKLMISDDEQRVSRDASKAVLAKIAAVGAAAASARYGHEIGECGICGRTLTNDESRARGIGPVCAAKAGW